MNLGYIIYSNLNLLGQKYTFSEADRLERTYAKIKIEIITD